MKIAAGCFGCLTLVCFMFAAAMWLGFEAISLALAKADAGMAADVLPILEWMPQASGGCCCLSAVITVALLAMGMSRGNNEAVE